MNENDNLLQVLGNWWANRQKRQSMEVSLRTHGVQNWLPTRGNVLFTVLMIALLLWAQTAGALPLFSSQSATNTSTSTIAYQGRLADADGNPLTDTVNMIFRLYSAEAGGTPLWEEQWTGSNGVRVSDGLFNVMLGSLTAIPASLITSNTSLFLGITVGTDDEMAPRVQLGTVPFAVQALTVPDGSVTTPKIADGAVTQAKLGADVSMVPPDGSVTTAKIADGAVTAEKSSGFVTSLGDNLLIQWGYRTSVTGNTTIITFPQAFAGSPSVVATADTVAGQNVSVKNINASKFEVDIANTGGNVAINWIAIGLRQ